MVCSSISSVNSSKTSQQVIQYNKMQSFVKAAVVLAFLSSGSFALPTENTAEAQKESKFWYPVSAPSRGSVTVTGANGGYNYYGNGANGGYIGVGGMPGADVYANGANGGENGYGNGANGGSISVNRREEDFFFPIWRPVEPANGPISASGANGGYNYGGNGANGGSISINRREDDFFFPIWRPAPPRNGAISASGANGGENYYGDGANGGSIAVNRREDDFFFPIWRPAPPRNGPISANGANGGYNYGGDGANGGSISIAQRDTESKQEENFFIPFFGWGRPSANGAITAEGANGGTNYYGDGANGGSIAVNRREDDFFFPIWRPAPPRNGPISASGANGGFNYNGDGANGGSIAIGQRDTESKQEGDFFIPFFGWGRPSANGAVTAEGANGGTNYYGDGANGGSISVGQ